MAEKREAKPTDVLRMAMADRRMLQVDLADKLGVRQSSISGSLNSQRMGVDVFRKILDVMDYDVCIVDRKTGEIKWTVTE